MRRLAVVIVILFTGCGVFNSEETVSFSIDDPYLVITNDTKDKIYYYAAEKSFENRTVWYPDFDKPTVKPEYIKKVHFSDIPNGEMEAVKKYDWIIIFWWTDDYKDLEDMHKEEIQIK